MTEQDEELEVLSSIYMDDFTNLSAPPPEGGASGGGRSVAFEIVARIPPQDVHVEIYVNNTEEDSKEGAEPAQVMSFAHVPPVTLRCVLPADYPATEMPQFALFCSWLESMQLALVCSKLEDLWREMAGSPIVYTWVEWIKMEMLGHLNMLGPDGVCTIRLHQYSGAPQEADDSFEDPVETDGRAYGSASFDEALVALMSYHQHQEYIKFMEGEHTCMICFCEKPGKEFVVIPCKHHYCVECMTEYCKVNINDGSVQSIVCPDTKCKAVLPPLRALVQDEELLQKWERLLLKKTLDAMGDVAYCPRCETIVVADEDGKTAQCTHCQFAFCMECRDAYHVGSCSDDSLGSTAKKGSEKYNDAQALLEMTRSGMKRCPGCRLFVEKNGGCNKIKCAGCGMYFCWLCRKAAIDYDHFKPSMCVLFEVPAENGMPMYNNQRRHNERNVQLEVAAYLDQAVRSVNCPNCRQQNHKIGTLNHIRCWACQKNFCYECKQVILKPSEHYRGNQKCKNHSNT